MNKILSVSVAAYNVENFIEKNLSSFVESGVLDQTEILVIDDGSSDRTAEIAGRYAERFPQSIRLIRKPNGGAGSTVNCGIAAATGKYFRMVDGDDWVDPKAFSLLVQELGQTDMDMVLSGFTKVDDNTGREEPSEAFNIAPGRYFFPDICDSIDLEMHHTVFRTSLLQENRIRLSDGFYTDVQYLLFPVPHVKTVLVSEWNVYRYRVSLEGQSVDPRSLQKHLRQHDEVLRSLLTFFRNVSDAQPESVNSYLSRRISKMAGTQLGTLLSFPPTKAWKRQTMAFVKRIQEAPAPVSRTFFSFSSVRLLRYTFGLAYRPLSLRYRKRVGLS